jgi:molybdenum cofactor guanylyltransferase
MSQNSTISAIVLAGGKSSRMGHDKALIEIQGTPLLRRVCNVALQCANPVYVVTPWQERYQNLVPDCQFIRETSTNPESPHGPLRGFAQGLAQVQTEWVLLLACDLPRLEAPSLQEWITQLDKVEASAIAYLPRHTKGWNPLCGFYRQRCLSALKEFIDQGGDSFQAWLAEQVVQELPLRDRSILFNCNTPKDLEALEEQSL